MNLIIARDANDLDKAMARAESMFDRSSCDVVLFYGGEPILCRQRPGTLFYPIEPASYDNVFVSSEIRLFSGRWADSLIAYAARLVVPGGTIAIDGLPKVAGTVGRYHLADAVALLGEPEPRSLWSIPASGVPCWRVGATQVAPQTTLSWYLSSAQDILLEMLRVSDGRAEYLDALSELPPRLVPGSRTATLFDDLPDGFRKHAFDLLQMQAYYAGGMAYKGSCMARIFRTRVTGPSSGEIVDIGGGYGLLVAELLLNKELGINLGTCLDISETNSAMFRILQKGCAFTDEAFRFVLTPAQDARLGKGVDLVSYIGSLLYVPKPLRPQVVADAFASLRPGGVLVVHENIRAPSYQRDFELMFEPDELDQLLRQHGPISYASSTGLIDVPAGKVGRSTVFRTVVKPL